MKYKPYLIQRINVGFSEHRTGMSSVCDYDYMGSSEFEWGVIPASLREVRARIDEYVIKEIKLEKPINQAGSGEIANSVYVLLRRAMLDCEDFEATVQKLLQDRINTKEYTGFDREFDLWQDVEYHLFFCFNPVFLRLIYCVCSRPLDYANTVQKELSIGDKIELAVVLNGKSIRHVRAMKARTGTVAGMLESHVTMKDHGKKFNMPYVFLLTHNVEIV